jgi:hypothetical protein
MVLEIIFEIQQVIEKIDAQGYRGNRGKEDQCINIAEPACAPCGNEIRPEGG